MKQKGKPLSRRQRQRIRKKVLIALMAVAPILFLSILLISNVFPAKVSETRLIAKATETPLYRNEQPEEEPESANSEIAGKWYGLCAKKSINTIEDFHRTVSNDPVLAEHFADFNWDNAQAGTLEAAIWRSVSYRKSDSIYRTRKKIRLPEGDPFITDGIHYVRTYCCNDYVLDVPPTEARLDHIEEKVDSGVRRQEMVAGPPIQLSGAPPGQASAGPPPRKVELTALSPAVSNKVIIIPNVPEPNTLLLMGTGLAGMVLMHTIRRKK